MATNTAPVSLTAQTAHRVAQRIEDRGTSVAWVIRRTGIPRSTFLRRLSGHSSFTLAEVELLAHALDTSATELIGDYPVAS